MANVDIAITQDMVNQYQFISKHPTQSRELIQTMGKRTQTELRYYPKEMDRGLH